LADLTGVSFDFGDKKMSVLKCDKCGSIHSDSIDCQAPLIEQENNTLSFKVYCSLDESDLKYVNKDALSKVDLEDKK